MATIKCLKQSTANKVFFYDAKQCITETCCGPYDVQVSVFEVEL